MTASAQFFAEFEDSWKVGVTVTRPPTRDRKGNAVPDTGGTHAIADTDGRPVCVFAPRATTDPLDRSDVTESTAYLYAPLDADLRGGDHLELVGHPLMAGRWRIEGKPQPWPVGLEAAIIRED